MAETTASASVLTADPLGAPPPEHLSYERIGGVGAPVPLPSSKEQSTQLLPSCGQGGSPCCEQKGGRQVGEAQASSPPGPSRKSADGEDKTECSPAACRHLVGAPGMRSAVEKLWGSGGEARGQPGSRGHGGVGGWRSGTVLLPCREVNIQRSL